MAVVLEDASPAAAELAAGFPLSPYFAATPVTSMPQAQDLMLRAKVDGIVRIRADFARRLAQGDGVAQILVHGTDANRARIIQGYAQGAIAQWAARRAAEGRAPAAGGSAVMQSRLWFNEANDSHYFLVPGPDRADHDADRRPADRAGHGARMGARHASRRCSSRRCGPTKSCSARRSPISSWG